MFCRYWIKEGKMIFECFAGRSVESSPSSCWPHSIAARLTSIWTKRFEIKRRRGRGNKRKRIRLEAHTDTRRQTEPWPVAWRTSWPRSTPTSWPRSSAAADSTRLLVWLLEVLSSCCDFLPAQNALPVLLLFTVAFQAAEKRLPFQHNRFFLFAFCACSSLNSNCRNHFAGFSVSEF